MISTKHRRTNRKHSIESLHCSCYICKVLISCLQSLDNFFYMKGLKQEFYLESLYVLLQVLITLQMALGEEKDGKLNVINNSCNILSVNK